jgi:hypothetical protein
MFRRWTCWREEVEGGAGGGCGWREGERIQAYLLEAECCLRWRVRVNVNVSSLWCSYVRSAAFSVHLQCVLLGTLHWCIASKSAFTWVKVT